MKLSFLLNIFLLISSLPLFAEDSRPSWHQSDAKMRTEKWRLSSDKEIEWVFDALGNRIEWNDWSGKTLYNYDLNNHLNKVTTPSGEKTLYAIDPLGKLLKLTYPSKKMVNYTYALGGALKTVSFHEQKVTYSYDNERDLLIKREMSSGLSTEYGYDKARRLSDIMNFFLFCNLLQK